VHPPSRRGGTAVRSRRVLARQDPRRGDHRSRRTANRGDAGRGYGRGAVRDRARPDSGRDLGAGTRTPPLVPRRRSDPSGRGADARTVGRTGGVRRSRAGTARGALLSVGASDMKIGVILRREWRELRENRFLMISTAALPLFLCTGAMGLALATARAEVQAA